MFCPRCGVPNSDPAQFCKSCGTSLAVAGPQVRYAGFWLRFWAHLIDTLILGLLPLLVAVIIAPLFFTGQLALAFIGVWIFLVPVILSAGWLYYAAMESSPSQATFGKRALGLKVTDIQGGPLSFGRASMRYFGKILSALLLNIGFLMAGFTARKQALHDVLADCLVIRG
jgi:uncharacterized RDD family membrane protein YckC